MDSRLVPPGQACTGWTFALLPVHVATIGGVHGECCAMKRLRAFLVCICGPEGESKLFLQVSLKAVARLPSLGNMHAEAG